ncbi:MAG: hypothetical protein K1Y36_29415 [Blastocatellia bacterium]|nr:hypothetical protein [Blastocatellia bacterium]
MKKFLVGLALGFLLGIGAAYGGVQLWNIYSPKFQRFAWFNQTKPLSLETPADIPVYPGAVRSGITVIDETRFISYCTSDPPEKVMDFYHQALPASGWDSKISTASQSGNQKAEALQGKKETRTCGIIIGNNPVAANFSACQEGQTGIFITIESVRTPGR